jgi:hypothetical protein
LAQDIQAVAAKERAQCSAMGSCDGLDDRHEAKVNRLGRTCEDEISLIVVNRLHAHRIKLATVRL